MQTLVFEETINTMTFIEYLTWNTTVFSLNVIELESLFSTFFSGRGVGMPILLIHYSYPQQQCNSSNTQMTLCDNQKRKTKEDFWIFYDRRKGMSYHHAKHTLGQITMCFLLFSILNKECVNSFYQIRQENFDSVWHLISIQHKNSHLQHIMKIHIIIICIPPNLLSRTY